MPVFRNDNLRTGIVQFLITALTLPTISIRRQKTILWDKHLNAGIIVFLIPSAAFPTALPVTGTGRKAVGRALNANTTAIHLSKP